MMYSSSSGLPHISHDTARLQDISIWRCDLDRSEPLCIQYIVMNRRERPNRNMLNIFSVSCIIEVYRRDNRPTEPSQIRPFSPHITALAFNNLTELVALCRTVRTALHLQSTETVLYVGRTVRSSEDFFRYARSHSDVT
jgi:hypothetical protein